MATVLTNDVEAASSTSALSTARQLRKAGQIDKALRGLALAIRAGELSAEDLEKAGQFLRKAWDQQGYPAGTLSVLLLGQFTTNWLGTVLTAAAWGRGVALRISEGQYDNVIQELMAPALQSDPPQAIVLLPWHQRLLGKADERAANEAIADELAYWRQCWQLATGQLGAKLVQVGYDLPLPGPLGYHLAGLGEGAIERVRQANHQLRAELPPGAYFVDLDQIAGQMGREQFYSSRRYYWTKQPFSEVGTQRLCEHLWAGLRAVTTGPKKVLVLDLDNTLWGGVVGETGPLGVGLGEDAAGEAYRAFQKYCKQLAQRGVVLTVASKNNDQDAREPFEQNPAMALKLDDFAAFCATWDPKALSIQRTAATLRLGLDSFVFFDDNPAEREHIRQALPEVEVVDVPEDPALYIAALQAGLYFESLPLTDADRQRSDQYRVEAQRRTLEQSFGSMDDYLASLKMLGDPRDLDDADMPRVVQLIGKTNQFNLTTRRHSEADVRALLAQPRSVGLTLRMEDRLGEHGLISVLLAGADAQDPDTLNIDTWLMSCRVIGRTAEEYFFSVLVERARELGYAKLRGQYIRTAKNQLVEKLYDRLGFAQVSAADGVVTYELTLAELGPIKHFITRAGTPS